MRVHSRNWIQLDTTTNYGYAQLQRSAMRDRNPSSNPENLRLLMADGVKMDLQTTTGDI